MATETERLVVALEARTAQFEKALMRANKTANDRVRAIENRFKAMNKNVSSSFDGFGYAAARAFAAIGTVTAFARFSDAATRVTNSLKIAGLAGAELESVYASLRDSAIKNAAPLEALVELYGRASLVQKELGISSSELLSFTDKVALALRVSGKSAAESSGALLQLSQALGSGTVRAEEFNSILEGALPIAQAAAVGLKEAGGSVAALRQLVVDGEISSEAFFRAFEAGSVILEQKVAGATLTLAQAFTNFNTAIVDTVREFNEATGASESFAGGIDNVARALADVDVTAFIGKIQAARAELQTAATEFANNNFFEQIAEFVTGKELTVGQPINLETSEAEQKLSGLQYEIKILEELIAHNKEMSIDTSGAESELATLLGMVNAVQAALAGAAGEVQRSYTVGTPGDPNALAGRTINVPERVKPVSLKDFAAPVGKGGPKGGGGSKRDAAAEAAKREAESVKELIADLEFERSLIGRTDVERETSNALRKAGAAATDEQKAKIGELIAAIDAESAAQAALDDLMDELSDLGRDALGGFIRDLREGKSASEALAGALEKIADRLLDIGLDSLFGGGGAGGIGGIIGKLFGFADGGIAAHGRPLQTFAKGGISKTAAIFGEAGPEAAVPLPDGRRIPVDLRAPSGSHSGRNTGGIADVRVYVDQDANWQAKVEGISQGVVRKAAPGIVSGSVKAVKTNFGGMMADAQTRNF